WLIQGLPKLGAFADARFSSGGQRAVPLISVVTNSWLSVDQDQGTVGQDRLWRMVAVVPIGCLRRGVYLPVAQRRAVRDSDYPKCPVFAVPRNRSRSTQINRPLAQAIPQQPQVLYFQKKPYSPGDFTAWQFAGSIIEPRREAARLELPK